jgi:hypothetical protein
LPPGAEIGASQESASPLLPTAKVTLPPAAAPPEGGKVLYRTLEPGAGGKVPEQRKQACKEETRTSSICFVHFPFPFW